jgi:hypothetical protein
VNDALIPPTTTPVNADPPTWKGANQPNTREAVATALGDIEITLDWADEAVTAPATIESKRHGSEGGERDRRNRQRHQRHPGFVRRCAQQLRDDPHHRQLALGRAALSRASPFSFRELLWRRT